jgi:hypothetical protein
VRELANQGNLFKALQITVFFFFFLLFAFCVVLCFALFSLTVSLLLTHRATLSKSKIYLKLKKFRYKGNDMV